MDSNSKKNVDSPAKEKESSSKRSGVCEVVVLSVVIGFSWTILLEPIIFYHLPDKLFEKKVRIF